MMVEAALKHLLMQDCSMTIDEPEGFVTVLDSNNDVLAAGYDYDRVVVDASRRHTSQGMDTT